MLQNKKINSINATIFAFVFLTYNCRISEIPWGKICKMLHGVFMSKLKSKERYFAVFCSVALIISILTLVGIGIIYSWIYSNIDFSLDESLFISNKRGNITDFIMTVHRMIWNIHPLSLLQARLQQIKKSGIPTKI